jgi:hypothetical protein
MDSEWIGNSLVRLWAANLNRKLLGISAINYSSYSPGTEGLGFS